MSNFFVIDSDEVAKAIAKATYNEESDIHVEGHVSNDTRQISVDVYMDKTFELAENSKQEHTVISEVFTIYKFKTNVDIVLSRKTYYTIAELSTIITTIKSSLKAQNKVTE